MSEIIERKGNTTIVHTKSGDIYLQFDPPVSKDSQDNLVYSQDDQKQFRENIESLWKEMANRDVYDVDTGENLQQNLNSALHEKYGNADKPITYSLSTGAYEKGGANTDRNSGTIKYADKGLIPQNLPSGKNYSITDYSDPKNYKPAGYVDSEGKLHPLRAGMGHIHELFHLLDSAKGRLVREWNAIDFTNLFRKALGLPERAQYELETFPEGYNPYETSIFDEISSAVRDFFQRALNWVRRNDPLVLDLDGDGIETLAADGSVLFDHNADGVKTGTGWIDADDGLLVLDKNGNGMIDNGRELFGDNTIKSDGTAATHGFDALSDLDENEDGVIDANDSAFTQLRVWQDLNSDGISQTEELLTLEELHIKSIGVNSVSTNTNVGHNNIAIEQGEFTYTDESGEQTGSAASLNLTGNNFHREFTDEIETNTVQNLPDMRGSGAVRDLREAA